MEKLYMSSQYYDSSFTGRSLHLVDRKKAESDECGETKSEAFSATAKSPLHVRSPA